MAVLLILAVVGVIMLLVYVVLQLNELEKGILTLITRMTKHYESR